MTSLLAIVACLGVFGSLGALALLAGRARVSVADRFRSPGARALLAAAVVFLGVFLLRPHEETFQGLDASAYRLMAKSLRDGRSLRGADRVLQEVPLDSRPYLLLNPREDGRLTRDRSFEVESVTTCRTKPFFYPFLPLCMNGLRDLTGGWAKDFFVPVSGMIFAVTLVMIAARMGGAVPGVLVSLMLLVGSPLVAWLFRGAYTETLSGILLSMAILPWLGRGGTPPGASWVQFFAIGLAVSFHPVMIVLAVPLAGALCWESADSWKRLSMFAAALAAGFLPILLLTAFVATPYGSVDRANLSYILTHSASIRPTLAAVCLLGGLVVFAQFFRKRVMSWLSLAGWRHHVLSLALLAVWTLPCLLAVRYWEQGQGPTVWRGWDEMLNGLQWPLGVTLLILCLATLVSRDRLREKTCLTIVFLTLPLFLYLKGAEHMGLWSQRRLVASLLLVLVCCLPAGVMLAARALEPGRWKALRYLAVVLVVVAVSGHNAARWPAPYVVRYEKGSDAWVDRVARSMGNRLTFFDYHPYSVPFAVMETTRAIGLSERGYDGLPGIARWLSERARSEEVLWVTAYANPGLEDGVLLEEISRENVRLERAHSKAVLPAEFRERVIDMRVLRAVPLTNATPAAAVHKILDVGPLALRGPWGRSDVPLRTAEGQSLPARWTREGCGIVGPVPRPGESVRLTLVASACRKDPAACQTLRISPPWSTHAVEALVTNGATEVAIALRRDAGEDAFQGFTGTYTFRSPTPYDPAREGIKGFQTDLGVLVHSIDIEPVK